MSTLLSRMIAFWRNGVSFGGNRDLYSTFGWKRNPQFLDFLEMYRRSSIAKRVVDAPGGALWADPPSISGDKAFQTAWQNLLQTIPVFPTLQRLDKFCGFGRYAVLFIGFDDGSDPSQPVRKGSRRVLYLQPYAETSVEITNYDTDPVSPRFGLPTQYTIEPGRDLISQATAQAFKTGKSFNVDYTRILHIAENSLEYPIYGRARLESIFNELCDLQKVVGAASETYWLAGNRGLHVDVDKEMELDEADEEALSEELKEYQHEIRRIIRTRGVKINEISSSLADPSAVYDVLLSNIAANTGIPKRVLMGSEAGQLASQQDRANWATAIEERIAEFGEPIVLLPFVRHLIDAGALPEPSQFLITWPDAFKQNPLERGQTSAQMARAAGNLSKVLQNIETLNQSMAMAANPQLVNAPMDGNKGSQSVPTSTDAATADMTANAGAADNGAPTTKSSPSTDSGFGGAPTQVIPAEPLMPKRAPLVLLTPEECRQIIGFGKHPPVFDATLNERISAIKKPGK